MKVFNIFVHFVSCFHKELLTLYIIKLNYGTVVRIAGCIHASPSTTPAAILWMQNGEERGGGGNDSGAIVCTVE